MKWQSKPLADICEFQRGLTYAKTDEVANPGVVVLRACNIDLATNLLDMADLRFIRSSILVPEKKKVRKNSLLVCTASGSKSHLGKVAIVDDTYDYAFGGFMGQITPKSELVPKYLFHLMTSKLYKDFIDKLSDGANINNLKFDDLGRFRVPLPSQTEQHRIVAILDDAFADIATAKTNAERSLRGAREVFETALQLAFTTRGHGWTQSRLEEIGDTMTGSTPRSSESDSYGNFLPFIKPGDFRADGTLNSTTAGLSKKGASSSRTVKSGSVLMVCIGATLGKCGYSEVDVATNQQINAISPRDCSIPKFIYYQMLTKDFQKCVRNAAGQATLPIINKSKWSALKIWIPPTVEEQLHIVEGLDRLRAETQHLESLYTRKLAALDELKQSLLHQAFSGQL